MRYSQALAQKKKAGAGMGAAAFPQLLSGTLCASIRIFTIRLDSTMVAAAGTLLELFFGCSSHNVSVILS